jgi:hypothetical protein
VIAGVDEADISNLAPATRAALDRINGEIRVVEQTHRFLPHVRVGGASKPAVFRSFTATPREDGELEAGISFTGDRLSLNVELTRAINSPDNWRLDGSYVGFATRKWAFVAGYPERWWGPGIQGSLILSTNARPLAQIGVERIAADGFTLPWLKWVGPWTVSTFIGQFDDTRVIKRALLFGLRATAKPLPQLEVAFSRTAQLCGRDRPCGYSEFSNMLLGKDNRGVNISASAEPGNQLAGIDGRWSFADRPYAVYWQWIGEDSRQGGPQIGSWLRMLGGELTGSVTASGWRHLTYVEMDNTICQEGGGGFGGNKYTCAYLHGTYQTGYRYEGRPLGYTIDADSQSIAVVSVLTGPGNTSWEFAAHSARLNQGPTPTALHSLSTTPASRYGVAVTHLRDLPVGRLRVMLSVAEQSNQLTGLSARDTNIALEWFVGYW